MKVPLMNRMGSRSILSVKGNITIDTIIYFDGDLDGHRDVMLRVNRPLAQVFARHSCAPMAVLSYANQADG